MSTDAGSVRDITRPPSIKNVEGGSNPPSMGDRAAYKAADVRKHLHSHLLPKDCRPLFSAAGSVALDCSADYSFVIRQFFNDLNIDSPLFSTEGMTTACNSMTGAVATVRAYDRYKAAQATGYTHGKIESSVDMVRGVTQGIGGTFYTAYRPLSITASIQGVDVSSVHAATALGRSTFITGAVGNGFFGVFYAAMSGYFGYMLKRMYSFRGKLFQDKDITKLDDAANVKSLIEFLAEKRMNVSPLSTLEKMLKAHSNSPLDKRQTKVKSELSVECMSVAKTWITSIIKEAKQLSQPIGDLSESRSQAIAQGLFSELDAYPEKKQELLHALGLDQATDPDLIAFVKTLSFAELLGLDIKTSKREKVKEAKLSEFVGSEVVGALKEAKESGLIERLSSSDPVVQKTAMDEAQAILQKASGAMNQNLANHWFLSIAGIIGVVATVISFILTGGVGAIVVGALFLACALAMLVPDVVALRQSHESNEQTGSLDKWLLYISTAVGVVSLVAVIVLGTVFSMGAVPLAVAIVIGILWLMSNCYSLYRLHSREISYAFSHPTMESLSKSIAKKTASEPIDQATLAQFKKLSAADRKAVKAEAASLGFTDRSFEKSLLEGERDLDRDHDFGVEFFAAHTDDSSVLRAVQKAYNMTGSESLRGLYDRLCSSAVKGVDTKEAALAEIRAFFTTRLSDEERSIVAQNIYNKRAKKASSRSFERITFANLQRALDSVSQRKKKEFEAARLKLLQHSVELFSAFNHTVSA